MSTSPSSSSCPVTSGRPKLSLALAIEPQIMILRDPPEKPTDEHVQYPPLNWKQQPTITLTATSHATKPITIFTFWTVFNLQISASRENFTFEDLTTNSPMKLTGKGRGLGRRPGFLRTKGHADEKYYVTLEPGIPQVFTRDFGLAYSAAGGLQRGHRYRWGVSEGEKIKWWIYGTKDEVLILPGHEEHDMDEDDRGEAISLHADPVEFEVR